MGKVPRKRGFLKTIDKILCLAYNNIRVKAIDLVGKLDPGDVNKLLAFFFVSIKDSRSLRLCKILLIAIDKSLCLAYNNIRGKAAKVVGKLDPGGFSQLLALFFIPIENSFFVCVTRYKCIKIFSSVNACDNICLYFEVVHITRTVLRRCSSALSKSARALAAGRHS